MKIDELLTEYFSAGHARDNHSLKLLRTLLEYWAREKDHEIKSDLLNGLVVKHSLAIKNLVELDQLKNRFLGIAAHDLRSPLVSVRGLSEILLTEAVGPLNGEQREYLQMINTTADGMLKLVNDLLDVSVIESGRLELHMERAPLKKLIQERIRIHRVSAREKSVKLRGRLADLPDQCFDFQKIIQVVDNLLSNAVKFSPPGSSVVVTLKGAKGYAVVGVRDQGEGIPEEEQARIFCEFQMGSTKPTRGEVCTGLGLAIAKRIVEAHCGTLGINSRPGAGSVFCFTLPLGNSDECADEEA
ncbi:MAG: sensor histidine kinase [Acidobacteriota bacterium]